MLISHSINSILSQLIDNEKNILFITFGERNLGVSNFIFGSNVNNDSFLGKDSFFNYTYQNIVASMDKSFPYDNILVEIYKITNEKFLLDYKQIIIDSHKSIIDNINTNIKSGHKNGMFSSSIITNEIIEERGHVIIKLKFFKFISENDASKSQREVEVIRSFTFVDIDGFHNEFINDNNVDNSLKCFEKFIECVARNDIVHFCEISSTLTDILTEIFTVQNLITFFFGFVSQYELNYNKSIFTLDIALKSKLINNTLFANYLQRMNISISQFGNGVLKEEFQILDFIYGEIIFYIENTFKDLNKFYDEIKDLDIKDKFIHLKSWLNKNKYPFSQNEKVETVFNYVHTYFKSRARWKCLIKAKTEIMTLTQNIQNNNGGCFLLGLNNITDLLKEKSFQGNNKKNNNLNRTNLFENEFVMSGDNFESMSNTQKKSVESVLSQKLIKNIQINLKDTFKKIYFRFTEDKGCMSCCSEEQETTKPIMNKNIVSEYLTSLKEDRKINFDEISAISKNNFSEGKSCIDDEEIKINFHVGGLAIDDMLRKDKGVIQEKDIAQRINELNNKWEEIKSNKQVFNVNRNGCDI